MCYYHKSLCCKDKQQRAINKYSVAHYLDGMGWDGLVKCLLLVHVVGLFANGQLNFLGLAVLSPRK